MKPTAFLRRFLAIAGSAALAAPLSNAATLYWDIDSSTAGSGGATPSGTWSTGGTTWSTDSTGATATSAYTTTAFDDLFFSAAADATGAYAVSLNSSTQSARLVTFEDGTATLSAATGTLSLGNKGGLTVTSGTVTGATISSGLTISGAQTFNVAAGRTLTLDTGTFTRSAGATLNVASTGTVTTTMTNLDSASLVNGIIGPWASFGSGTSTRYATIDGSNNIVAYTGGTAAATAAGVTSTLGTVNYDVAAVGTLGAGANINTLRYTGAAGTIAGALTTNGIMNVGGGALVFSGAITSGSGGLVLNAANGNITLSSGLNNSGNLVVVDGAGQTTISGGISGAGGLTKSGSGKLILGYTNTFTGPIRVLGGVLNLGTDWNNHNNAISGGYAGSVSGSNVELNGGVLGLYYDDFNRTLGNGAGQIQITGGRSGFAMFTDPRNNITFYNNSSTEVVWGASGEGAATGYFNPSVFVLNDAAAGGTEHVIINNPIDLNGADRTIETANSTAASYGEFNRVIRTSSGTAGIIKTGVGELKLSNAANTYNGATVITAGILDAATFANVNTNSSIGKGSVGGSAADLVINGGTLRHSAANVATTNRLFSIGTSGGTIDSSGSGTNTLSFTGTGAMGFNSQLGTRTLTLRGSNTGSNNMGVLIGDDGSSNATSVTKTDAGLWILSNASNSYTGPTTITAGTLSVSSSGNLGAAASNLVFNGGTLQITNTTNLPNFSTIGHTVLFTSGKTVGLDISSGTFTADQVLNQGTGGLTKAGAGTLVINSAHTYTGVTTISAGTLQLDSGGSIASSHSIINNAIYLLNQNATTDTAPLTKIAGSGSIAAGVGTTITIGTSTGLRFNALNTTGGGSFALSGGVTIPTFGGLVGTTGNLSSSFSSGYTSGVTSLTLNTGGNSFTYGGVINDGATGMTLTKTGAGTQTLTGTNTYTGTTFLNGGTLAVGSGSTIGKITGTTDLNFNGGTLQFNRSTNADINAINNAATITVNASSTFGVTSADAGGVNANETIGAVTLNAGQMNFNWTNGASSGAQMILTSLSRSGTASAAFNGTLGSTGRWKVTGAGSTTAGQILGPWYTIGAANAGLASTDYAVFGSDFIAAANIAGSAETAWTTAGNAYTNALAAQTLTGTRTITALRNTGATATLTLATGVNLETYGLLNGVSTLFTVAPGTGGFLTTPTGGGNLYVNAGAGAITVSAPINNNSGNVTLVKNGSGTLTLTSTTSNLSGGVVLNAGTLAFDDARNIGGTNNTGGSTAPITVNGSATMTTVSNTAIANLGTGAIGINTGAILTLTGASRGTFTIGGAVTGDGGVTLQWGSFWGKTALNSTSNTFKGALTVTGTNDDGNSVFSINSIADGAGYGNIVLNVTSSEGDLIGLDYGTGGTNGTGGGGATAPLVLDHRQIVIQGTSTNVFNNSSNQAVTINTDLGFSGTGARSMRFGISSRAGSGINTFAGKLTDNVGGAFTPTFGGGTWVLTNANTFTGTTTVSGGILMLGNALALQNSVLDTTNSVAGTGSVGLRTTQTALTLGGLTGNKNFASTGGVFSTTSGGYGSVTALTLNPGSNASYSYTGVISNGATGMSLTKSGLGTQILTNTQTYTGATTVSAGTLEVSGTGSINNSSSLTINSGATFRYNSSTALTVSSITNSGSIAGSGNLTGITLGGTGSVDPGNSPGILTASATDPSGGLDYNFEMTAGNTMPTWSNAAASVNDVLRLTGATPFVSNLGVGNVISVYFGSGITPTLGDVFTGGFYTDNNAAFLSAISSATFQYFVYNGVSGTLYNGTYYDAYTGPLGISVSTFQVGSADFAGGTVTNGYVTQFTVVPEPGAALIGSLGLLALLRRRRN